MVHDVLFGVRVSSEGVKLEPFMPLGLRNSMFASSDTIALNGLNYRGKRYSVVLNLSAASAATSGGSRAGAIRKNGMDLGDPSQVLLTEQGLTDGDVFEVDLVENTAPQTINLITDTSDYKRLFGPRSPSISSVNLEAQGVRVNWDAAGETPAEVSFDVLRDGVVITSALSGVTTSWVDTSATSGSPSYCYSVRAHFVSSGNTSQDAAPACFWGTGRIASFTADQLTAVGGTLSSTHGKVHQDVWGDDGNTLTVPSYTPSHTGAHLLQIVAGNGAGPINTGVTCGAKRLEVRDLADNSVVASGVVVMPQIASWDTWEDSSFLRANLDASHSYSIALLGDATSVNMSAFSHFAQYTGGEGGVSGAYSRVNVAEIKILSLSP
jgi:hypothetical protein